MQINLLSLTTLLDNIHIMSVPDKNYTDPTNTGEDSKLSRVGDQTNTPAINEATNREIVAKMANLLEGLQFPATKEDIKDYLNTKSPAMGNRINDVIEKVQNNLEEDGTKYQDVYDIARATGLVKKNM
jgi:hypothetical protein